MHVRPSIVIAFIFALLALYLSGQPMHFRVEFDYSPHPLTPHLEVQFPDQTSPGVPHEEEPEEQPRRVPNSLRAD